MSGRAASILLLLVLVPAMVGQSRRATHRLWASSALKWAETSSLAVVPLGEAGRPQLGRNLQLLRRAAAWDPAEAGIPLAVGSIYRLLDNPQAAIAAYQRALTLESRAETHLNLGHAQARVGDLDEARASFARALALDPRLEPRIPAPLRPSAGPSG